jgi:dephospho-CoA kinase
LKLIGLTGGAGSGKSTVARILRDLGAAIIDADTAAHAVYAPGTPGFELVVREFGPEVVREGRIDRARLGELVFNDAGARHRLNAIVHPLVRDWMAARTAKAVEDGAQIVVQDVPLLFENGLQGLYSEVILVYVPAALQVERLVARGQSPERANAMIAAQMPIEEKRKLAGLVVDNSGSRAQTRAQVVRMWTEVLVR